MSRWYPHLDYDGDPMAVGQFRFEQPTAPLEVAKRDAAIRAMEAFCEAQGFPVPPLNEVISRPTLAITRTSFLSTSPDGQQFGIGYEMREPVDSTKPHRDCDHLLGGSSPDGHKRCCTCGDVFDHMHNFIRATGP